MPVHLRVAVVVVGIIVRVVLADAIIGSICYRHSDRDNNDDECYHPPHHGGYVAAERKASIGAGTFNITPTLGITSLQEHHKAILKGHRCFIRNNVVRMLPWRYRYNGML